LNLSAAEASEMSKIVTLEESYTISDLVKNTAVTPQKGQQRYILTGGPGAGKTSIIDFLAMQGYLIVSEAATEIIAEGLRQGIEKPWRADDYHIRMYELISKRQIEIQNSSAPIVFFDRGHLDGLSYILLQKRTLYQSILDCVQTSIDTQYFNNRVFFIDSLGFVVPGPARDEDLQESLQKAHCLEQNYRAMGYEIIHILPGSVEERAQMIIHYITKWNENK
jgi:predicted ATPase